MNAHVRVKIYKYIYLIVGILMKDEYTSNKE